MKVRKKILSIWGYVKKWVSDVFILIRRKRKNIESILGQIGWYIIVFGIGAILFLVQREHQIDTAEHSQILFLLVATTGVTVAILISFFFSKLFSERNERIQRKRLIDKFSNLIYS